MSQLHDYQDVLEQRVRNLEAENAELRAEVRGLRERMTDREAREATARTMLDTLYPTLV